MSKSAPPPATIAKNNAAGGKAARLAEALRDNLNRRKAQQRARHTGQPKRPKDKRGEDPAG